MQNSTPAPMEHEERAPTFFTFALNKDQMLQRFLRLSKFDAIIRADNVKGLLLFENPVELLASQLADSADTEETLRGWIDEAVQHLEVLRRQRGKIVVLERSSAEHESARSIFQSTFPGQQPPPQFRAPQHRLPDLVRSIATLAVRQHPIANQLLSELQASSVVQVPAMPTLAISLETINRELSKIKARQDEDAAANSSLVRQVKQLQDSLETTEAEKKQLQDSLETINRELSKIKARQDEDDAANSSLVRQVKQLQDSLETTEAEKKQLQDSLETINRELSKIKARQDEDDAANSSLVRQVMQLQDSLETAEAEKKQLQDSLGTTEGQKKQIEHESAALQAQLDLVYGSTSWRITAPMRAVRRLIK